MNTNLTRRPRMRSLIAGTLGAILGTTMGGGVASAGALPLEVRFITEHENCVRGTSNKVGLTVQVRSASGSLIQSVPAVHDGGDFSACFDEAVRGGQKVRAVHGGSSTTFRIPRMTVKAHRAGDVVAGTGPAGKAIKVRLYDCSRVTFVCTRIVTRSVTIRSDGTWRRDFTSVFDARGYDEARVTYESSAGHRHTVTRTFPFMMAVTGEGSDVMGGRLNASQKSTFRLRSEGGTILSTRTRTGDPVAGAYSLGFGEPIEPGQRITGTFADDARLTVWPVDISVTYKGDDQFINGTCLPDRAIRFEWQDGRTAVRSDSTGYAFVNLSQHEQPGYRLFDGARLQVSCENSRGDIVVRVMEYRV